MSEHEGVPAASVQPGDDRQWVVFPGGELEGERPKALCGACRAAASRDAAGEAGGRRGTLCFQCYRAGLDRTRALKAAADLDTASAARFQALLPFEPVNRPRLAMLKVQRGASASATVADPGGRCAERRRQAQIAARRAVQRIVRTQGPVGPVGPGGSVGRDASALPDRARAIAAAIHAAELQLPESWLPFVVAR
jgi:hypothetical protein